MSQDGAGVFKALTASGQDNGGGPSLRALSASGVGTQGGLGAGAGRFEALRAAGASPGNFDGQGAASFAPLTASGHGPNFGSGALLPLSAAATGLVGGIGAGAASFRLLSASGVGSAPQNGTGAASFQALVASARGAATNIGTGSAALAALRAQGAGLVGGTGTGAPHFLPLLASGAGYTAGTGSGAVALPRLWAYGAGAPALAATLNTWAMNTRTNAVTSFPSYPVNSYARYNGVYLGAGPSGLLILEGGSDADADGSLVDWLVRTGQLDDKKPELKRLVEVLLGARLDGPVRVRIYRDDTTSFDQMIAAPRTSDLQQVRVKGGKGSRSRYYMVELSAQGVRAELDSLQANMVRTARRVG